jgi:hypothetical protein
MSNGFLTPGITEKLLGWLIEKGGPVAGISCCLASLSFIALQLFRKNWEGALFGFMLFWLAVGLTSVFFRSKRNAQIVTTVAAEQIIRDRRNPDNGTSVPEVHRAIVEQIVNGNGRT